MRTSSLLGGLVALSASSRAISRSILRCMRSASRIAVSAVATSSSTAAKAARHSASGRASPLSPSPAGEASANRSANLRRAVAAAIVPCRLARSSFSISMRLSSSGRLTGGAARGGLVSMAPMVSFVPASPSTRSEDGSSVSGKSFATSVVSPEAKIERDDARDAGAIGIDGDRIDHRGGIEISRPGLCGGKCRGKDEAGRDKTVYDRSHDVSFPQATRKAQHPDRSEQTCQVASPPVVRRCDRGIGSIEVSEGAAKAGPGRPERGEARFPGRPMEISGGAGRTLSGPFLRAPRFIVFPRNRLRRRRRIREEPGYIGENGLHWMHCCCGLRLGLASAHQPHQSGNGGCAQKQQHRPRQTREQRCPARRCNDIDCDMMPAQLRYQRGIAGVRHAAAERVARNRIPGGGADDRASESPADFHSSKCHRSDIVGIELIQKSTVGRQRRPSGFFDDEADEHSQQYGDAGDPPCPVGSPPWCAEDGLFQLLASSYRSPPD